MKKLLAMLLALAMALGCTLALAEEGDALDAPAADFPGLTARMELDVDAEALSGILDMTGMPAQSAQQAKALAAILDALDGTLVVASDGLSLGLNLKGAEVLSLQAAATADGLAVASTLFPSYVLTASADTLNQLMQAQNGQLSGLLGDLDTDALTAALQDYADEYVQSCQAAITIGTPEEGEFELEGHTFNTMLPINVDVELIRQATLTLIDRLQNDPNVKALLEKLEQSGMLTRSAEPEGFELDAYAYDMEGVEVEYDDGEVEVEYDEDDADPDYDDEDDGELDYDDDGELDYDDDGELDDDADGELDYDDAGDPDDDDGIIDADDGELELDEVFDRAEDALETGNPTVNAVAYVNLDENGSGDTTGVVVEITAPGETDPDTLVTVLAESNDAMVRVEQPKQDTTTVVTVNSADDSVDARMDFTSQGMYLGLAFSGVREDSVDAALSVYFLNPDAPLATCRLSLQEGGELTLALDDAGKTVLSVESLADNEEASMALVGDIMFNGLLGILSNASTVMSDEVGTLIASLFGGPLE